MPNSSRNDRDDADGEVRLAAGIGHAELDGGGSAVAEHAAPTPRRLPDQAADESACTAVRGPGRPARQPVKPSGKLTRTSRKTGSTGVRELAAQATRESILLAAIEVFAKDGFAGGRVDEISRAANSHDRMIYYYFESKEGLYIAVLEEIYRRMNAAEEQLELRDDEPVESLAAIIRFVLRYYQQNPSFITLLNTENLYGGRHVAKSPRASEYSSRAIDMLRGVLAAGAAKGVFRNDLVPLDIYLMIASMGYFPMSNRHTLKSFLGQPIDSAEAVEHWEEFMIEAVMRVVAPVAASAPSNS